MPTRKANSNVTEYARADALVIGYLEMLAADFYRPTLRLSTHVLQLYIPPCMVQMNPQEKSLPESRVGNVVDPIYIAQWFLKTSQSLLNIINALGRKVAVNMRQRYLQ